MIKFKNKIQNKLKTHWLTSGHFHILTVTTNKDDHCGQQESSTRAKGEIIKSLCHLMTSHLMLFLTCFSVIFNRFYIQKRGVLDQLLMILAHL